MTTDTLAGHKAAITDALKDAPLPVDTVLGYEPGKLPPGISLTVSTAGVTSVYWLIVLRVYVSANQPPETSQRRVDTVIDTALDYLPDYGPDEWSRPEFDEDLGATVTECILEVPRAFGH